MSIFEINPNLFLNILDNIDISSFYNILAAETFLSSKSNFKNEIISSHLSV